MSDLIELWEGREGEFWVLTERASHSLLSHIRNVEKQSNGNARFRVRDFLDVSNAATHEEWQSAARRTLQRYKNSPASAVARAGTHLAAELLQLFDSPNTWRGVLNRLTLDALSGRVRDFADTVENESSHGHAAATREFSVVVKLAQTVYLSPDAQLVVAFLFEHHGLAVSNKNPEDVDLELRLDGELEAERRKLEAQKRAEEQRWQLEQERMEFERQRAERDELLRRREEERREREQIEAERREREAAERRRRAEEAHRRKLAEREAIKPGTYRIVHTAAQAMAGLMPSDVQINLQRDGSFVYQFQANIMGMMNTSAEATGRWQYDPNSKTLTMSGSLRLTNLQQPGDWFSNMFMNQAAAGMPPQPLFMTFTVQNYSQGRWEGYDNERNHCVLHRI